jgi:hypothetical protein
MLIGLTFGVGFALGVLAALFARGPWGRYAVYFGGLLAGAGLVLGLYLSSAPDALHGARTCSHCRQLWGRYWEPEFAFFLAGIGFLCYLAGAGIGASLRAFVALRRETHLP